MPYQFKVEGLENLHKKIEEKRKEIGAVFEKDLNEGADAIVASAKSKAPVGTTGNLKAAIGKNEVWERGGKYSIYVGIQINEVFTKADGWYARMQEMGTSKMKAQPYLRPALRENQNQIHNNIESDLKEVIGNEGAGL
jgi:HK97 gp10 family phage protein